MKDFLEIWEFTSGIANEESRQNEPLSDNATIVNMFNELKEEISKLSK